MCYLGIDVHVTATVWCLLEQQGTEVGRGKIYEHCEAGAASELGSILDTVEGELKRSYDLQLASCREHGWRPVADR